MKNLFDSVGLEFNPAMDINVLKKMYEFHVHALAGTNKVSESPAKEIPATPVNVQKNITDGVIEAQAKFKEIYGYPVPDVVVDDLAFYDGLSNPDFDAEAYIASKSKEVEGEDIDEMVDAGEIAVEPTIEQLRQKYFDKFGTNVANIKKNDAAWIKAKLAE